MMTKDKNRLISELYLLRNANRQHSPITALCDRIEVIANAKKCNCACFELAWLKFECQYEDGKALVSIREKYGDEVANVAEQVLMDWKSGPEHFGERISSGNLPQDAFLDKLKDRA